MSIYASTARFDSAAPLSEDQMRKIAPSIFATDAHESRSERFQPIPTIEVLRGLSAEGFLPVGVQQSRCRTEDRKGHTKHLIRLRRVDEDARYKVGDTVCEILLKNANDGSSAYDIMAGLFRIRCMNSLVAQTGTVEQVKVRHSGEVGAKVIEGTFKVLGRAQEALAAPQDWSALRISQPERLAFGEAVRALRMGDEGAITAAQFIEPRREGDRGNDLWTTFNVAQENAIRGGLRGVGRDANNRRRTVSTRAVKGIDGSVALNKALWTLATEMAKIKAAA